jgi:hypothetical protein
MTTRHMTNVLAILREKISRHIIGLIVDEDGRRAVANARITVTRTDALRPVEIRAELERDLPMVVRLDRIDFDNACTCGRDAATGEAIVEHVGHTDSDCLIHGMSDASNLRAAPVFPEIVYGAGVKPIGRSVPDHLPCKHSFTTVDGAMWVCAGCGLGRDAEAMRVTQGVNVAVTLDDPREYELANLRVCLERAQSREAYASERGNRLEAALGKTVEELAATREILGRRAVELEQLRRKAKR